MENEEMAALRRERDEWKTKALDVEKHPVVVALRVRLEQAEREVERLQVNLVQASQAVQASVVANEMLAQKLAQAERERDTLAGQWGLQRIELRELARQVETLRAALWSIAALGGNLTDERLERVGGENEGRDRAIKFIQARQMARDALAASEWRKE